MSSWRRDFDGTLNVYFHGPHGSRWTVITSNPGVIPCKGEQVEVPTGQIYAVKQVRRSLFALYDEHGGEVIEVTVTLGQRVRGSDTLD